jgi:hypothetical protein
MLHIHSFSSIQQKNEIRDILKTPSSVKIITLTSSDYHQQQPPPTKTKTKTVQQRLRLLDENGVMTTTTS